MIFVELFKLIYADDIDIILGKSIKKLWGIFEFVILSSGEIESTIKTAPEELEIRKLIQTFLSYKEWVHEQ